jgi:hypothetical protein
VPTAVMSTLSLICCKKNRERGSDSVHTTERGRKGKETAMLAHGVDDNDMKMAVVLHTPASNRGSLAGFLARPCEGKC